MTEPYNPAKWVSLDGNGEDAELAPPICIAFKESSVTPQAEVSAHTPA